MADFDEIWSAAHGGASQGAATSSAVGSSFEDIWSAAHKEASKAPTPAPVEDSLSSRFYDWLTTRSDGSSSGVVGPLMTALDGLTLGFGDEVVAGGNAALDRVFDGVPMGYAYDQRLQQVRDMVDAYQESSPAQAATIEILGAANLPIKSGIGGRATVAGKTAQAAAEGAGLGALYGFGSGEGGFVDRTWEGLKAGGVGLAAGAVATPVIEGTTALARGLLDYGAQRGLSLGALKELAGDLFSGRSSLTGSGERGSFAMTDTGERALTKGELYLANRLRDTPDVAIQRAAEEMAGASRDNIPLFLPEALESPRVTRNARFIANYDPSMEAAQRAIVDRVEDSAARASNYLGSISPVDDAYQGAANFVEGATDILEKAEQRRADIAAPLYNRAYLEKPLIDAPELSQLMEKDKVLQKAINSVKQTANNADLADNATEILVKARHEIGNQIEAAQAQGLGRKARDLTDTYNRLNKILKTENPFLADADEAFAVASDKIQELSDTFLSNLKSISPDKIQNVGQVFTLPARRIAELKERFIEAGKGSEWNAGIRAHLQNVIETTKDGRNFTDKITGSTFQREKLQAALGDRYWDTLRRFQLEDKMFKGRNAYNAGSTTAGNLEEANNFRDAAGLLSALKDGDWRSALGSLFRSGMPDDLAQEMAAIYFNPQRGADALERIRPLLTEYARNKGLTEAVARGAETTITRGSGALTESGQDLLQQQSGSSGAPMQMRAQATPAEPRSTARSSTPDSKADLQDISYDPTDNLASDLFSTANIGDVAVEPEKLLPLVEAVIKQESGGRANAVSEKGALGLMQVMPATAREIAAELGIEEYDLKDPETNRLFGTHYLKKMLDMFDGDVELALTAYHSGPGRVRRLLDRTGGKTLDDIIEHLGPVGQKYARQVLGRLDIVKA